MTPLKRIGRGDRHELLPYQTAHRNFATEPVRLLIQCPVPLVVPPGWNHFYGLPDFGPNSATEDIPLSVGRGRRFPDSPCRHDAGLGGCAQLVEVAMGRKLGCSRGRSSICQPEAASHGGIYGSCCPAPFRALGFVYFRRIRLVGVIGSAAEFVFLPLLGSLAWGFYVWLHTRPIRR